MSHQRRNLLLIEDSYEHAELAMFYIAEYRQDIDIIHLPDGGSAMQYLESIRNGEHPLPWLCLLDLKLPKYDGHEILSTIKEDEYLARIPVVVFTTSAASKDIQQAVTKHANSFITKPMGADRYGMTIDSILKYWELNQHERI